MRTITVKGMGKISVKPNLIVVSFRVESKDKDYDKTLELGSQKIDLLNKSLEKIGFEKNDIKTTNFDVQANYESVKDENGRYRNVFKEYCLNHNLKVEFDFDMKRLGEVLHSITQSGTKPEFSISFTVKDPSEIKQKLLEEAAKEAKETAKVLCRQTGVKLGDLVSIDYNWDEINVFSPTLYKMESRSMVGAKVCNDIQPENINLSDNATFVWEIL